MRMIKSVAFVAALTLSAVASAQAQGPRPFRDSWFWGAYGGLTSFTAANTTDPSATGSSSLATQVGGDWLITRKAGGLYLSFAQAFVTSQGAIENGPTSADTGFRFVDVKNLRRLNLAAMAFPGDYVRLHPYIGFGIAFDYLGAAAPIFTAVDTQRQEDFAQSAVSEVKAALGPLFMAGAQYRALNSVSAFGQFTAAAMSKDFLLSNGNPITIGFQVGLRYNLGSSIEREP
jgi:opacity protein-like surface antigen